MLNDGMNVHGSCSYVLMSVCQLDRGYKQQASRRQRLHVRRICFDLLLLTVLAAF